MDALATAHNNHLQKINDRETQFVKRANAWKADLIAGVRSCNYTTTSIPKLSFHTSDKYLPCD